MDRAIIIFSSNSSSSIIIGIEGKKELRPGNKIRRTRGSTDGGRKEKIKKKKINLKFKGPSFVARFAFVNGSRFCGTGRERGFLETQERFAGKRRVLFPHLDRTVKLRENYYLYLCECTFQMSVEHTVSAPSTCPAQRRRPIYYTTTIRAPLRAHRKR